MSLQWQLVSLSLCGSVRDRGEYGIVIMKQFIYSFIKNLIEVELTYHKIHVH